MRTTKSGGRNGSLSIEQRQYLCRQAEENPSWTQTRLSKWVEEKFAVIIDRSTVSKVLKRREEYMNGKHNLHAKRLRGVKYPDLENSLKEWCLQIQSTVPNISDKMIVEKAHKLASDLNMPEGALSFSNGWVDRFKKRNGIRQSLVTSADCASDVSVVVTTVIDIQTILSAYKLQDIYSLGSTRLYYSQLGTSEGVTSAQQQMDHRDNKETVSVLLCCNSSASDMVPPLVIGQYQNPRSLRDLQARPSDIQYEFNPPASLSVQILQKWLKWFDDRMSGRKVILLLDEVYSSTIEEWSLCHVRLHFLPSKSAIRTYPMSAGILENFRAHYKYSFASWLIQQAELGSLEPIPRLNLLDTLVLVAKSWCDISADVIRNSWNMAKVLPQEIDRSQLSLLSNLSDSPKLPSVLFTSTDSELTARIESIMEHLSRVAPAAYADFLALMEEGNSVVNQETTPLIDEASFDSSTRSFDITPNPSNSNVSFGAHNLSNAEYLEYRRDEVEGSETHSENNLSEINHTDRIDSQHSPPSTSETTIQTTQTPLPLPSQSHFSAHDDYQPSQPTFYSDRQAQDAIRNLCLYFLYRTDSDVGARLMLDAEKILNEELRKRRQRAGPYHIPDSTNGNEPANKYKFTSGQGN